MTTTVMNETRGDVRVPTLASALRTPRRSSKHEIEEVLELVISQQNEMMKRMESLSLSQGEYQKSYSEIAELVQSLSTAVSLTDMNAEILAINEQLSVSSIALDSAKHQFAKVGQMPPSSFLGHFPTKIATMLCGASALGLISAGIAPSSIFIPTIAAVLGGVLGWANLNKLSGPNSPTDPSES